MRHPGGGEALVAAEEALESEQETAETQNSLPSEEAVQEETAVKTEEASASENADAEENLSEENQTDTSKKATPSEAEDQAAEEAAKAEQAAKKVQKLIDQLPSAEELTAENIDKVKEQLSKIEEKLNALSEDAYAALDLSAYDAVKEAAANFQPTLLMAKAELAAPAKAAWDAAEVGKATWTPVANATGYEVQLYSLEYGPTNKEELFAWWDPVTITGGNVTSYVFPISDLTNKYVFGVKALNNGESGPETRSEVKKFTEVNVDELSVTFWIYNAPGGRYETKTVKKGEKLTVPTQPKKDGYTFKGWLTDDGVLWDFDKPIIEDMHLTADWKLNMSEPDSSTLKWHSTNVGNVTWGTVKGAAKYELQLYRYIAKENKLENEGKPIQVDASKTTYTFEIDSIYKDYVFSVRAIDAYGNYSKKIMGEYSVYATHVNVSSVDVKFDANGGSPSPLATNHARVGYKISPPTVAREGYVLTGWKVVESGAAWNFNNAVNSAMTLQAIWTKDSSGVGVPTNLQWNNYTVGRANWNAARGAAGYVVQLYGWSPSNQYKIGNPVKLNASARYYVFPIDSTIENYVFSVAAIDANGNIGQEVFSGVKGWDRVNVEYVDVKFNANGGYPEKLATLRIKVGYRITDVVKPHEPARRGYKLVGWRLNPSKLWNMNDPVTTSMTLDAEWEKLTPNPNVKMLVTFDTNGGSPAIASQRVTFGGKIQKPNNPTRSGYTFVGWLPKNASPGAEYWNFDTDLAYPEDGKSSTVDLVAIWTAQTNSAGISSVKVQYNNSSSYITGTITGNNITVKLPAGSKIPTDPSKISIAVTSAGAKVSNLKTENGGKTWTFTVTAADGKTTADYKLYISVKSSGGSGGGGGGSSSGGGGSSSGGGSFSGSGVNTVGGPGAAGAVNLAPNGTWKSDAAGWKFQKTDGAFPQDAWYECVWNNTKNWYHFNNQGYLNSGWLQDKDGRTYYLHDVHDNSFGYMYTGWHWIGGKCYFFNPVSGANGGLPYGALVKDTLTSDGYTVNAAGEWTVNGVVQLQNQQ